MYRVKQSDLTKLSNHDIRTNSSHQCNNCLLNMQSMGSIYEVRLLYSVYSCHGHAAISIHRLEPQVPDFTKCLSNTCRKCRKRERHLWPSAIMGTSFIFSAPWSGRKCQNWGWTTSESAFTKAQSHFRKSPRLHCLIAPYVRATEEFEFTPL